MGIKEDREPGGRKGRLGRWLRPLGALGLVTAVLGALLLSTPTPARAGWNGQQVIITGAREYSVHICGLTNNGGPQCGWFTTPSYTNPIGGWWWAGVITIDGYDIWGNYFATVTCWVPGVNPTSDWWTCNTGW